MVRKDSTEHQYNYSTAKPLFNQWAVQNLQSFSASRVKLYIYNSFGQYVRYRALNPVQYIYIYHF